MLNATTKQFGQKMEQLAEAHLKQQGLLIYKNNFHCKMGEIDLICLDKNILVFVEVRFRKNLSFGGPMHSITLHKQKKLIRTAKLFILKYPWARDHACRFDVVGITRQAGNFHIEWLQNAFEASSLQH